MASASAPAFWPAWIPVLTSFGDEQQYGSISWIKPFLRNLLSGHSICQRNGNPNNATKQQGNVKLKCKNFTNQTSDKRLIYKVHKELENLDTFKPRSKLNMGYRSEQKILKRGISNIWEEFKEMFNILGHQENENENDSEIPSQTFQSG